MNFEASASRHLSLYVLLCSSQLTHDISARACGSESERTAEGGREGGVVAWLRVCMCGGARVVSVWVSWFVLWAVVVPVWG